MKRLESKIQSECYKWYNNNFCLKHHNPRGVMFSVPNELAGRNALSTMLAKSTGLLSGVSDTIVIKPDGEIIFVEFKTKTGTQSESQQDFQKRIEKLGYRYEIIRSFESFKKLILL